MFHSNSDFKFLIYDFGEPKRKYNGFCDFSGAISRYSLQSFSPFKNREKKDFRYYQG